MTRPFAASSSVRVVAQCRGEGLGYVALAADEVCGRPRSVACCADDAHEAYGALRATGLESLGAGTQGSLRAVARLHDGTRVACMTYAVGSEALRRAIAQGPRQVWVVVVPLLSDDLVLEVFDNDDVPVLTTTFRALLSKVRSRALATTRPEVAAALRGYERAYGHGIAQVRIQQAWPGDEGSVVWRVRATFATVRADEEPRLHVFDDRARPLDVPVFVMEDQVAPSERDAARLVRLVTFSCVLPQACGWFHVVASQGVGRAADGLGLDGMNPARAQAMVDAARVLVGGAAHNPRYAAWFEEHRATPEELVWQRQTFTHLADGRRPLVSLVVPVAGEQADRAELLRATIASAREQTYGAWELLLAPVDTVALSKLGGLVVDASAADRRICVIGQPRAGVADDRPAGECAPTACAYTDERSDTEANVATDTCTPTDEPQAGVANAVNAALDVAAGAYVAIVGCGDVLEPDILWRVCATIADHPQADVLYTDEDRLTGTTVHDPAFKTLPNFGKLYCHDYVGRLMVVSRWALERMGRPGEEVAAAYDYDLALRAFEVARKKVHVPGVLYHRRDEAGAKGVTGAVDAFSVPLSHEAGRRALTSHLARRGIAARVADGALPGTYCVQYELADPRPLVSIVIPTRDHADLLRACVTSILNKSTYDPLEVVLVENNSAEESTFALYDELCRADDRVHVVTWEPPAGCEGFNYSALVNFGVSQSAGELLVLLNNDTEVIEPRWLEHMAGQLMRPEVGVVGAKLLFRDGLVQHVGMAANPDAFLCHVCQNLTRDALGPGLAAAMPGDYAMVTGACQMMRRSLFEQLEGYDEKLAVGYNDGDFCLRAVEAGYAVTVAAQALLYHREFSSRGRESFDARLRSRHMAERALFMRRHVAFLSQGDPALNPCLDPFGAYFDLR